jgi:DNA-binding beta-propeller fold protein YncE
MKYEHRLSSPRFPLFLAIGLWLAWPAQSWSQSIAATLPVAGGAVAVNRTTDKIYVAGGLATGVVTVIDGKTHSVTTVPVGTQPVAVAVDEPTNKIYVANFGCLSPLNPASCHGHAGLGSVTVIDGVTNATTTVVDPNASFPCSLAVNPSTNKVFVANSASGNVSVIDGVTNSAVTVTNPNGAHQLPSFCTVAVAVNPATNKIYVTNSGSTSPGIVTVIDGTSKSTTTLSDPHAVNPVAVAVNAVTNRVYVANNGDGAANHGNVTVIDGDTNAINTVVDPHADRPVAVTVDSTSNKIYVMNAGSENVTVIDGVTNSTTTVTDPNAAPLSGLGALRPVAAAVNEVTNTVYVANGGCDDQCGAPGTGQGSVTVIDGRTNSVTTIINPSGQDPDAVAVNPLSNEIYVANGNSRSLTVIDGGGTASTHTLAVVLTGSGTGTVTASPIGIDCGAGGACADSYAIGTAVKLTASAGSGSYFTGWNGPCVGTNSCDLATNQDQFVTATFSPPVAVPGVAGMTQMAATTAMTGAGLVVGSVTQQPSSFVASGSVISESPMGGADVAPGSAVNLVVSTGEPSSGGGGSLDLLTLGSLLGYLLLALRRAVVLP